MLYPQKNLIPDFYSSQWFDDTTVPVPTVQIINPYKIIMTNTQSAQGRLIWIPVEIGKTYTFSFKYISGLYRIYRRKVNNHDSSMVLIQDSVAGKPDTFTFTVDASYQGFITLRLTYGGAGVLVFENLQLEEGSVATDFSPYELGMKAASAMKKRLNQQVINSDTTGTGGHQYAVGNVMYVKKDIKLNDSQIIVSTAGTFNVAVYEWQDGKGVVGQPIWKKDAYYDVGTYTYSFGGLILREGKKYWFGRYDETGGAKVGRTIGLGTVDYKTISTYGGARFTDSDIAFGTTYYYFYGLEVEDLDMRISTSYAGAMKPAILYPKKNLLKPVTEWENTNIAAKSLMPSSYRLEFDADVLSYYRNTQVSISKLKPYTISAQYLSDAARVAIREVNDAGVKTFITNITAIYMSHTFTPSASAVKLEIEATVKAVGYCVFDKIQVEVDSKTDFSLYELVMKPL
jgi:hypothetical protein